MQKVHDFAATVAHARQYQDASEQAKVKKPNIRMASAYDPQSQIQPVLDGLQRVLETVLDGRGNNRARVNCVQGESDQPAPSGNGRRSRRDSSAHSDRSRDSLSLIHI